MKCNVFIGTQPVIIIDDDYYNVDVFYENKSLKKNVAYIIDDYVYVYRGKVKSKNDLSNYKYYFDKKEKCWKKNYYLNFQYFDSRYPNTFDEKVEKIVFIPIYRQQFFLQKKYTDDKNGLTKRVALT